MSFRTDGAPPPTTKGILSFFLLSIFFFTCVHNSLSSEGEWILDFIFLQENKTAVAFCVSKS